MKFLRIIFVTGAFAVIAAGPAAAAPADPRLASIGSWAFAIGSGNLHGDLAQRYAGFGLVVVDGEEVSAKQVAQIKSTGTLVIAYLSVGSIERGRGWYKRAKPFRLEFWDDWGEWYANVARPGFRDLIAGRVAPKILNKGVDGLFLDNVDMIETHAKQKRGMKLLVKRLADSAHARGGFLFAQNGAEVMTPMLPYLDGWNREDVGFTYEFENHAYARMPRDDIALAQDELRKIGARGLLTLATSYTDGAAADREAAAGFACDAGALPFVSNIRLTRVGAPLTCP